MKDIRLCIPSLSTRVSLFEGVRLINACQDDGATYENGAAVPFGEFRNLTAQEQAYYASEFAWPQTGCIASFSVQSDILEQLKAMVEVSGNKVPKAPEDKLWECLASSAKLTSLDTPRWLGFTKQSGRLATTTIDGVSRMRVGLHIDSWEKYPVTERERSSVRVCINLGDESRFLLAIPLTVAGLLDSLTPGIDVTMVHADPRALVSAILRSKPDISVLRVEIPPGWAYLAPTENLIHDGSSPGTADDMTATWLGRITLAA